MAEFEKEHQSLITIQRYIQLLALYLHLHVNSQAWNSWTERAVIYLGRVSILTSLSSHFPGLSRETAGHLLFLIEQLIWNLGLVRQPHPPKRKKKKKRQTSILAINMSPRSILRNNMQTDLAGRVLSFSFQREFCSSWEKIQTKLH